MIAHLRDQLLTLDRFAGPVAMVATLDDEARVPYLRAAATPSPFATSSTAPPPTASPWSGDATNR